MTTKFEVRETEKREEGDGQRSLSRGKQRERERERERERKKDRKKERKKERRKMNAERGTILLHIWQVCTCSFHRQIQ